MRIATWNVNSLRARLEKVLWWLDRASPDVLLMQETKLVDEEAPVAAFREAGYELAHHGQRQWNGVAIASRVGMEQVTRNFGSALEPRQDGGEEAVNPFAEARMIAATCGDVSVASLYAPNGRSVDSPYFTAKLEWFRHLNRWLEESAGAAERLILGGDLNVAPADIDVWDPAAFRGSTHVSLPERAAFESLCQLGLTDIYRRHHPEGGRYTWWDYRGGNFHKNVGMRIDHLLISTPLVERAVWTEIDREARKGKPLPSDHAPLVLDLDERGKPFDPGWPVAPDRR
ncbi:MAG: exodeoxyribonuclease III [Spirochaetia bacterium]